MTTATSMSLSDVRRVWTGSAVRCRWRDLDGVVHEGALVSCFRNPERYYFKSDDGGTGVEGWIGAAEVLECVVA